MKDNFSSRSAEYARFRPAYPAELFSFLFQHCHDFDRAWDCGEDVEQHSNEVARQPARRPDTTCSVTSVPCDATRVWRSLSI